MKKEWVKPELVVLEVRETEATNRSGTKRDAAWGTNPHNQKEYS